MNGLFRPEWSTLKKLMFLQSASGGSYATITGNPVSFSAKAAPLRQLSAAFSPVQSGTGDPSPDNVRPISGWSSLTVYHSGADTSDPRSISISLGSTVYSGYADVVTGVLTVTMASVDLGTLVWGKVTNVETPYFYTNPMSPAYKYIDAQNNWKSSQYTKASVGSTGSAQGIFITNSSSVRVRDSNLLGLTGEEFKTAMSGVQLVYELATPFEIQLTPQEVQSLLGENTLWSNANQPITVEYRKN